MTRSRELSLRSAEAEAANEPVRVPGVHVSLRVHNGDVRRRGEATHAGEASFAKQTAASEPAHSLRAGSKGVSSGAARPSSTSGASRSAVAGASVTPSIPCPVAR
jgi:hypothetical protein